MSSSGAKTTFNIKTNVIDIYYKYPLQYVLFFLISVTLRYISLSSHYSWSLDLKPLEKSQYVMYYFKNKSPFFFFFSQDLKKPLTHACSHYCYGFFNLSKIKRISTPVYCREEWRKTHSQCRCTGPTRQGNILEPFTKWRGEISNQNDKPEFIKWQVILHEL